MGAGRTFAKIILDAVAAGAKSALRASSRTSPSRTSPFGTSSPSTPSRTSPARPGRSTKGSDAYAGDFTGTARIEYDPDPDGDADPGEVVWAWVPYEEDHTQGKDRPVLVIGRHDGTLLGLMLTSKDHDRDAAQEARYGRIWFDVGAGPWDGRRRPSEVRLDRVLRLRPSSVRREGAALGAQTFRAVADALRDLHGWP